MKRDHSDLEKIKEKLSTCTPFSPDPSLRNIVTGVVAKEEVNVHEFETVGNDIIEKMIGKPVFGISFKRKDRAKTPTEHCVLDGGSLVHRLAWKRVTVTVPLHSHMQTLTYAFMVKQQSFRWLTRMSIHQRQYASETW